MKNIYYANTWDTLLNELYKMGSFYIDQQIKYDSFPAMRASEEIKNILRFAEEARNNTATSETFAPAWKYLFKKVEKEKTELERIIFQNMDGKSDTDRYICQNFHYNLFIVNSVLAIMLSLQNKD